LRVVVVVVGVVAVVAMVAVVDRVGKEVDGWNVFKISGWERHRLGLISSEKEPNRQY
jgi:hypothetical protein